MMLPVSVVADESKMIVRLDGKTLFVPELPLMRKINPITSFLYMGSWALPDKSQMDETPLAVLDLKNSSLYIEFPKRLLGQSKPRVLKRDALTAYLDGINWGKTNWNTRRATQFAFKAISVRRQPVVLEMHADFDVVVFLNGQLAGRVSAASVLASGGRGFVPLMIEAGENVISAKQFSTGEPRIELSVRLDHANDLQAAWQSQNGLLKKLVLGTKAPERAVVDWPPGLGRFSVSAEVRDVAADAIVIREKLLNRGMALDDAATSLAPGIYEAVYRTENESASEFFIVGNPKEIFAGLSARLSKYNTTPETNLNIEAQLRRGRILLTDTNYNMFDRQWQEKLAYTFSSLATIERSLKNGAVDIAKDQPGLHIRGFASALDNSTQFYRLFVPSTCKSGAPLPLLVCAPTRITNTERPFIEGPVMASHREALLWAKNAEKHGFAILWPGYRNAPEGQTYECTRIEEAIQAVEKDYNIDKHGISVFATCSAGYNAGRLISEYDKQFAAIVYDRAIFDHTATPTESFSVREWHQAVSPSRHVIENQNLRIFVMHDNTSPPGHGPMELAIKFLGQAKEVRDDVVSYLSKRPMSEIERMDMVFSWLASCRNENPSDARSHFLEQSGYQGPIMEIFTTPIMIVEGSHALDDGKEIMRTIAESIRSDYMKYFHGAECIIKKDVDVTENDIKNNSLILIGNTMYNSVWKKLQPRIPLRISLDQVLYKNKPLAKGFMFEAITRHPDAPEKYILLIGTGDVKFLQPVITNYLFNAWYDCLVFSEPLKIIGKLDDARADTQKIKVKDQD